MARTAKIAMRMRRTRRRCESGERGVRGGGQSIGGITLPQFSPAFPFGLLAVLFIGLGGRVMVCEEPGRRYGTRRKERNRTLTILLLGRGKPRPPTAKADIHAVQSDDLRNADGGSHHSRDGKPPGSARGRQQPAGTFSIQLFERLRPTPIAALSDTESLPHGLGIERM